MRIIKYLLFICVLSRSATAQTPPSTQKEIQVQMEQAKKEVKQQILDLEAEIAKAKRDKEDPESIKDMENLLAMMKKAMGVAEKGVTVNDKRLKAVTNGPFSTVPPYKSPFIRIPFKQTVIAHADSMAKDRLLWYKGRRLNDSMLLTTKSRLILYSKRRNMVIVQPNEKKDSSLMKIVRNLGRSRQWTNNYVTNIAAKKNSFFDYPLVMMTMKEFDLIEKEYNKIADNTIKLPQSNTNLAITKIHFPLAGRGSSGDDELNVEDRINPDAWLRQMQQELRDLMNSSPPLDFPAPPRHEFDLCYYCDTSLQAKFYSDVETWHKEFTRYETKLIQIGLSIHHHIALSGIEFGDSGIPNLEEDIDRASSLAFMRMKQKLDLLKQQFGNDVYRQEVVLMSVLSLERQKALLGAPDDNLTEELGYLTSDLFKDFVEDQKRKKNYNIVLNYALVLGFERQLAILGAPLALGESIFDGVLTFNRFALTMNVEFQMVVKDEEDNDIMRTTGYLSTPQKTYVSLGRNNCKFQLYLFDTDYLQERRNEEAFEIKLMIMEGVKLIKEKDEQWLSFSYTGPAEMKTVFPSVRIDFCQNGVQDSALMDVVRYSDQDLTAFGTPDAVAKRYTIDLQEYVNLVFGSLTKSMVNRDAVIDISDEIMDMQLGTTVQPTGYNLLDKMQMEYKMQEKLLQMKEKITNHTKESTSVILFDALNESAILIDKEMDMSGDKGYKIIMKKAFVKIKVEHEPL